MKRIMGDALVMRLPGKRLENGGNTGLQGASSSDALHACGKAHHLSLSIKRESERYRRQFRSRNSIKIATGFGMIEWFASYRTIWRMDSPSNFAMPD
tara:strand:+ start:353 stop:643 length:291 start_codon:yes stop_codon:yes gene_type:complete